MTRWPRSFRAFAPLLLLAVWGVSLISAADRIPGKWIGRITLGGRSSAIELVIELKGTKVGGTVTAGDTKSPIQDAKITENEVTFSIPSEMTDVERVSFRCVLDEDSMRLVMFFRQKGKTEDVKVAEGKLLKAD
jgi:hypothetical protein